MSERKDTAGELALRLILSGLGSMVVLFGALALSAVFDFTIPPLLGGLIAGITFWLTFTFVRIIPDE